MGSTAASSGPWDAVPSKDQLFVLVTGANSGIGLGICQRLIDEFLITRSPTTHLILTITTRSEKKSLQTLQVLREHVRQAAARPKKSGAGPVSDANAKSAEARVHLLSVELDLCNLPSVYAAGARLRNGLVPRIDSVVFNAGIGGWKGVNWFHLAWSFVTIGLIQSCTWPPFKLADAGHLVDPLTGKSTTVEKAAAEGRTKGELLGECFCANVFGHYVFAHELVSLLSRSDADVAEGVLPGRIIWESSIETAAKNLTLSDFQGTRTLAPYESSKRLTDVLALTSGLPRVKPWLASFFKTKHKTKNQSDDKTRRPYIYLTHPGVVVTPLFPLHPVLMVLYAMVMNFCRWIGSPWHPVTPYRAAVAPVWYVLEDQETLDAAGAARVKFGSSCARGGYCAPKRTEVEGWGWDGRLASEVKASSPQNTTTATGIMRDTVGRRRGAVDLLPEAREDFEELGAECWKEMERLRLEWDAVVSSSANGNGKAA